MATITLKKIRTSAFAPKGAYNGTTTNFCIPLSERTGMLKNIFSSDEERKKFENALGLPEGELLTTSAYYKELNVVMKGDTMILDSDNPMDELTLKIFEHDNLVVTSEKDKFSKPNAIYMLVKGEEVSKNKVSRRAIKAEAYSIFTKMSIEDMKNALLIYGKNPKTLNEIKIKELIGDEVEDRPERFLTVVNDKDFAIKVFVNDLIQENVIIKSGSVFMFDSEPIAHSTVDMVNFIKDKKNSQMVLTYKKILADKKGIVVTEE